MCPTNACGIVTLVIQFIYNIVTLVIAQSFRDNECLHAKDGLVNLSEYVTIVSSFGLSMTIINLIMFICRAEKGGGDSGVKGCISAAYCILTVLMCAGFAVATICGIVLFAAHNNTCIDTPIGTAGVFALIPFNIMFLIINFTIYLGGTLR